MPNAFYRLLLRTAYHTGVTARFLRARRREPSLTVLYYHGVRAPTGDPFDPSQERLVTPEAFQRQLQFVKLHFTVLPLHEAVSLLREDSSCGPLLAVTFDDGDATVLSEGLPLLEAERVPFTAFLPTALTGGKEEPWWARLEEAVRACNQSVTLEVSGRSSTYDLRHPAGKWQLYHDAYNAAMAAPDGRCEHALQPVLAQMAGAAAGPRNGAVRTLVPWEGAKALARSPLGDLGSHTVHHWVLSRLDAKTLRQEVLDSKQEIEERAGVRVFSFSYPYGERASERVRLREYLAEARYHCAITGEQGFNRHTQDPYELRRVSVLGTDTWPLFVAKLTGLDALLRRAG
ncbi:MAG: polysaccharide deacetylase family protein [Dehalococcoidia bacterium]|nr:polysaccharide deacetylase family protein [Dehalococcoidia bacterium]